MTKTIVFGLDGVLCNFIQPAVKKGYELAGRPEPENWVQSCWDDYGGLTKDEIAKLWEYIEENPKFTDPGAGDYTLKKGSPCIGAAKDGANIGCF